MVGDPDVIVDAPELPDVRNDTVPDDPAAGEMPEFEHLDEDAPDDAEPVEPEPPSPPNDEANP